jgi:hypothetical protein
MFSEYGIHDRMTLSVAEVTNMQEDVKRFQERQYRVFRG